MSKPTFRLLLTTVAASLALAGCQTSAVKPQAAATGPGGCKPLNNSTPTDATTAAMIGGVVGALGGAAIGRNAASNKAVGTRNGALFGAIAGAVAGSAYAKLTEGEDGSVKLNVAGNVLFPTGSATLGPDFKSALNSVASTIQEYCGVMARIVGHTDNVGSYNSNLVLSQRRAQAVKDYLVQQGVDPGRLTSDGQADSVPVASNADAAGRQQNRRVEIFIYPPAS